MTNKEKLSRLIIEKIHNLPYEEAIKKEKEIHKDGCQAFSDICGKKDENGEYICKYCKRWGGQDRYEYEIYPITIGRVMRAFSDFGLFSLKIEGNAVWIDSNNYWQLTDECGQEYTLDDQSEETINKLLELLQPQEEVKEIPMFKGTMEKLNNLSINF